MAKEFTAGEYLTRGGEKAVVFGVVPNEDGTLLGYRMDEGRVQACSWNAAGQWNCIMTDHDLMPNKKKLERWGYWVYSWFQAAHVFSTREKAEESRALEECPCSEVFKYPDIEVEE